MKPNDFIQAVQICTQHHTNEVIINKSNGHASNTGTETNPTLHIKNCCATVTKKLQDAGFSLFMKDGLLSIEKF